MSRTPADRASVAAHRTRSRASSRRSRPMRTNLLRSTAIMLALVGSMAASAQDAPRDTSKPVQPVPGAMPGSDTVPSTLSEKNAADDKLITIAYTFKNLADEQRRAIYQALKDNPVRSAFNADIG